MASIEEKVAEVNRVLAISGTGLHLKETAQPKTSTLLPNSYELVPISPAAGGGSGPHARAPDGSHLYLSQITFLPKDYVRLLGGQFGVPMKLTYEHFMKALRSFSTSAPAEKKRG